MVGVCSFFCFDFVALLGTRAGLGWCLFWEGTFLMQILETEGPASSFELVKIAKRRRSSGRWRCCSLLWSNLRKHNLNAQDID